MRKISYLILGVFVLFILSTSCGDDDEVIIVDDIDNVDDNDDINDDDTDDTDDDTGDEDDQNDDTDNASGFEEVDINVVLPADSNLDLTTTRVRSLVDDFEVSAEGNSQALHAAGTEGIALLLDEEDNVLLMGFVTDNRREISVRTTLEVALFYNLGTIYLVEEIREIYFREISNGINIDEFVIQAEALFNNDQNFIESESFSTQLAAIVQEFAGTPEAIDIRQSANIRFSPRQRSGVELREQPGNNVFFRNTIRRRAHAFFYKTASIDESGNETILINDIAATNGRASNEAIVNPAAGVNNLIGTLQNLAGGKGSEFLALDSPPTTLTLDDDEFRATYMARLVGPGVPSSLDLRELTDLEADRLFQLQLETFALDIVIPVIGLALSLDDSIFGNLQQGNRGQQSILNAMNSLVGSIDPLNTALRAGDFNAAREEFFIAFRNGVSAGGFQNLLESIIEAATLAGASVSSKLANGVSNLFAGLQVADRLLAGVDLARVFGAVLSSNLLEEWEIIVRRGEISVSPEESSSILNGDDVVLTATVEDGELAEEQFYEFVWTSTGRFGSLNGNTTGGSALNDRTSITTTSNTSTSQITYVVEDLDEGEEEITVEVFLRQGQNRTRINDDFAIIQVLPTELLLRPDDATLEGGGALVLFVEDEDGNDITQSEDFQYSIVWQTAGSFGKFNGNDNIITEIDDNSIQYQALELIDEGEERIIANVYRRPRGTIQSFRFLEAIDATINIENDPNIITFIVGASVEVFPIEKRNGVEYSAGARPTYEFDPLSPSDPRIPEGLEVESYSIRIREQIPDFIPSCTFNSEFFSVREDGTIDPDEFNLNGRLAVSCGGRFSSGSLESVTAALPVAIAFAESIRGFAEVTVRLREAN